MGRKKLALLSAAVAATMAGQAQAAPPNLANCPRLAPREGGVEARKTPLPIPRRYAEIARANRDRIAVSTLGGGIHCTDTRDMLTVEDFGLSSDQRFFSYRWGGYEAGGFMLVDRTGRGQEVDTGDRPVFSPSRHRFAAIEISESGFGSLNGFAVWQVGSVGVRRLTFLDNLPQMADWRLDGWAGEACIDLSSIPMDKYPEKVSDLPKVPRVRYAARAGAHGWAVARGSCPRA
jgi:hypothetical protein